MPCFPIPLHSLAPESVSGPFNPNAPHDEAWAAWQTHVDAGRIGERAAAASAAPVTPPEPSAA